jgi:hypothetical protein
MKNHITLKRPTDLHAIAASITTLVFCYFDINELLTSTDNLSADIATHMGSYTPTTTTSYPQPHGSENVHSKSLHNNPNHETSRIH